MKHKYLGMLLAVLIVLSSISYVCAENIQNNAVYVSTQGSDANDGLTPETSKKTIQDAINKVKNGGTVIIKSGTYKETLTIDKYVQLVGEGPDKTILDANYKGTCIDIKPGNKVLIEGISIKRGYGWRRGGGIYNYRSNVTIKNCVISNNKVWWQSILATPSGGGIYNYYGDMVIENSTIQHNEIHQDGAGIASVYSNLLIKGSIIQNNFAPSDFPEHTHGGGVYVWNGNVTLENTIIRNNYASFGGGLYLKNAYTTINNCIIQNNMAQVSCGGIYIVKGCSVNVDDATEKQCVNNSAPSHPNGYWD